MNRESATAISAGPYRLTNSWLVQARKRVRPVNRPVNVDRREVWEYHPAAWVES